MTNRTVLLWASFLTLIAAGVGFGVRTAVIAEWGAEFGFTKAELGQITGGGLTGFGVMIIVFSSIADKVGFKRLLVLAFALHVLSALVTVAAGPLYEYAGRDWSYRALYYGLFMFAMANGVCETVINPLVATLYPHKKTHYLNILHAGWPGGLILGGLLAYLFVGNGAALVKLRWEIPILFFLLPAIAYAVMFFKESFPDSEAREAGVPYATMLREFLSPLLIFLFVIHAMVGFVELGVDNWFANVMENVIGSNAILLVVYTWVLMFVLRFFAGPIVEKINPLGLLFVSAVLGCVGLYSLGATGSFVLLAIAATVYGVGKTFFWPTMLGVVGERFPKGGALVMGTIGGIGMLSAGMLGAPAIGYMQDRFAGEELQRTVPTETYDEFISSQPTPFLAFPPVAGLDGAKLGEVKERAATGDQELSETDQKVLAAAAAGGQEAFRMTAIDPLMMAVCYLILVIYFRAKGGYKVEVLHGKVSEGEQYTGGVEGPVE